MSDDKQNEGPTPRRNEESLSKDERTFAILAFAVLLAGFWSLQFLDCTSLSQGERLCRDTSPLYWPALIVVAVGVVLCILSFEDVKKFLDRFRVARDLLKVLRELAAPFLVAAVTVPAGTAIETLHKVEVTLSDVALSDLALSEENIKQFVEALGEAPFEFGTEEITEQLGRINRRLSETFNVKSPFTQEDREFIDMELRELIDELSPKLPGVQEVEVLEHLLVALRTLTQQLERGSPIEARLSSKDREQIQSEIANASAEISRSISHQTAILQNAAYEGNATIMSQTTALQKELRALEQHVVALDQTVDLVYDGIVGLQSIEDWKLKRNLLQRIGGLLFGLERPSMVQDRSAGEGSFVTVTPASRPGTER